MTDAGTHPSTTPQDVQVDFLYLDLSVCDRCRGTGANLERAEALLRPLLATVGAELTVRRTHVTSAAQADRLGMMSSPTLLVNGRDIAGPLVESPCGPCSSACGCGDGETADADSAEAAAATDGCVDCRVWTYRGESSTAAPVGLIVDAVLAAVYGQPFGLPVAPNEGTPESLARFFAAAGTAPDGEPQGGAGNRVDAAAAGRCC